MLATRWKLYISLPPPRGGSAKHKTSPTTLEISKNRYSGRLSKRRSIVAVRYLGTEFVLRSGSRSRTWHAEPKNPIGWGTWAQQPFRHSDCHEPGQRWSSSIVDRS